VPKAAFALGERACRKHRSSSLALHQSDSGYVADVKLDSSVSIPAQVEPSKRRRSKSYYQARRATRAKRKAAVREFATSIGCPISVLTHVIPAAALLHLPGFIRAHFRTVHGVRIASEDSITKLEIELATSHGTATATFKLGAYVTDPVKLVRMLNVTGKPLVIGGDFGGGSTKLGCG